MSRPPHDGALTLTVTFNRRRQSDPPRSGAEPTVSQDMRACRRRLSELGVNTSRPHPNLTLVVNNHAVTANSEFSASSRSSTGRQAGVAVPDGGLVTPRHFNHAPDPASTGPLTNQRAQRDVVTIGSGRYSRDECYGPGRSTGIQ